MTVFIVHGFNSRRHAVWMSELGRIIEAGGHDIVMGNYGHTNLFTVKDTTDEVARSLAASACKGDIAIGHSNGCTAIHQALYHGAGFERVIYLNAALPTKVKLVPWLKAMDVFYAPDEIATLVGAWWAAINPFSGNWGAMGRRGYRGQDPRVTNFELGPVGHSGALEFSRRRRMGEAILDRIAGQPIPRNPLFRA